MTKQEIEASIRAGLEVLAEINPSFRPHLESVVVLLVREVEFWVKHEREACAQAALEQSRDLDHDAVGRLVQQALNQQITDCAAAIYKRGSP